MASHSYKYPLGHYITARYWHGIEENGLHFTISDTGWGKALWGKLYGQWLCEATVFTYDYSDFYAKEILSMIQKYKIKTFCAPPTVYRFLVHVDLSHYDLSSLTNVTTAGEALNPEIFRRFQKATGLSIMEGFGQTETTLLIGTLKGTPPRAGSMGKPSPQYDVHLLKPDGTECAAEEVGEICVKTSEAIPNGLFLGYFMDPEKTQAVWHDGFYHTGDTAYMDKDGYLWYVGRVDDIIKSAGYRVGPFEIENEIMRLPYVLECAATSIPDAVRGQAIKASIVLADGVEATDILKKEIMKYLRNTLASYKRPKTVEFVKELPKTSSGKVRRVEIKEKDWEKDK
jgi:acetyl-CoA synthetase